MNIKDLDMKLASPKRFFKDKKSGKLINIDSVEEYNNGVIRTVLGITRLDSPEECVQVREWLESWGVF